MKVRELMSRPAVTVSPGTPIRHVAALLTRRGISGVPVVDDGRLVGVVSATDIVEKEAGGDEPPQGIGRRIQELISSHDRTIADAETAGEAMTSPPVTTTPEVSARRAAQIMTTHDVDRLPVVNREELVGVISRADLVEHFARPDDEIERDIRSRVIAALFVPDVRVAVHDGRAVLEGVVDKRADLEVLPHAVAQVPGVVSVESTVTVATGDGSSTSISSSVTERVLPGAGGSGSKARQARRDRP